MMMKNYDELFKINHNPNWSYISNHPHRILIIAGSRSGETNVLLNLRKHKQPDIGKIHLYVKDLSQSIYHCLSMVKKS